MDRDLPTKLYDGEAERLADGTNPGASTHSR
jgi:hypothetical protein